MAQAEHRTRRRNRVPTWALAVALAAVTGALAGMIYTHQRLDGAQVAALRPASGPAPVTSAPTAKASPPPIAPTPGAPKVVTAAAQVTAQSAAPAAAPYVVKHILPIDGPMHLGDYYWDESGAPPGEIVITIDLKAQVLSIFRAGYEIGTATILYGDDSKPTPLGIFPITQKDADHVSNIYTGAPMPYMLRLTNDGITIHGSMVEEGYATHGCVGVPVPFAKKLFHAVKLGDKVIVTNGERLSLGEAIKAA